MPGSRCFVRLEDDEVKKAKDKKGLRKVQRKRTMRSKERKSKDDVGAPDPNLQYLVEV